MPRIWFDENHSCVSICFNFSPAVFSKNQKVSVMYQLYILVILFAFSFSSPQKQEPQHCCSSAPSAFASLANDPQFRSIHEAPLPSNYVAIGRMITFPTPDGKTGR